MPILSGDIKLVASQVMDDVPEGGGAPTSTVILDGVSNAIFPDISEVDRAGGRVSLRKLHVSVQTGDTATYMGANLIVAEPPEDPNVSVTLFSTSDTFDRRTNAANRIESYLSKGPKWNGFLLENHIAGQRLIQLCQRLNTALPTVGRTLCLIADEGLPTQIEQYIRVIRVSTEVRTFTEIVGGAPVDFDALLVLCDLSDALRYDFKGTAANRLFVTDANATITRDTSVSDAGQYFGVVPIATPVVVGDVGASADSVYTQLVPSAQTESIELDQKPAAQRQFTLAATPRLIEVGLTPHSKRIRVVQENRGASWVQMLRPLPAPNTVVVSYLALGEWYTLMDDGTGNLSGSGVGTVNYVTGSISITLPALPDDASSIVFSWGEKTAYTNRAGQAGFRAPEFSWELAHQGIKANTVTVTWMSGGVLRTATDAVAGVLSGDATGQVNYASGKIYLRPAYMIDAGGEFSTDYTYSSLTTKTVAGLVPDAGGFATIALDEVPFPGSITVKWITVRNVSTTSGASQITTKNTVPVIPAVGPIGPVVAGAPSTVSTVRVSTPRDPQIGLHVSGDVALRRGATIYLVFRIVAADNPAGMYSATAVRTSSAPDIVDVPDVLNIVPSLMTDASFNYQYGTFQMVVGTASPVGTFYIKLKRPDGSTAAVTPALKVFDDAVALPPTATSQPSAPAIKIRETTMGSTTMNGITAGIYPGGFRVDGLGAYTIVVRVAVPASYREGYGYYYDPPDRTDAQWTSAELANSKLMMSVNGVSTAYSVVPTAASEPLPLMASS